ncbi:Myb-like DNA-binding domain containing protein [Tritrichomonas foetus]|uniref:Myb-like DNA-binding domain containing protein n=1 Tax=Tritrichomonas foetus TaxID=1144522 RepID=A0A1J4L078_9EUKA|nr:Myb-like DNA-binding domain containing protein [Tritrichomonas foetus]|eukprot:OHT16536.1 Myb-like DNA-binding domain containing protein [Tritrichomonas foetus]
MSTEIEPALAPTRARYKTNNCVKNVKWTKAEDELLIKIMSQKDRPNYSKMVDSFVGKTGQQIAERWDKVLNPNLVKGSWTRHEDEIIIQYVKENGTRNWRNLCSLLPGRIGKQCRERWRNHLDPSINHSPWTEEEDEMLRKLHREFGNKWVKISSLMKDRSDNAIKNRWNSTLKKKELENVEFEKPEIDDTTAADPSPMSTPKLLTVISTSPFAARDRRIGFFSPIFHKQSESKDRPISLTDNRNALLEMIPQKQQE